jgi:triacylglycerol lipase
MKPAFSPHHVVLLHGIDDTGKRFRAMAKRLREQGLEVHVLELRPNHGSVGIDALAEQVRIAVETQIPKGVTLDIVGFSMGGIVARYYLQILGGAAQVRTFVSISSPHHGSRVAYLRWNVGGRQLRPNSPMLNMLNRDVAMLQPLRCISFWTPHDVMILPAESSVVIWAECRTFPVWMHHWMLTDNRVICAVCQALSTHGTSVMDAA